MSGNPKTYPAGTVVEYTRPSWGSDQWVSGVIVNESDGHSYGIRRTGDPEDYFLQDIRISNVRLPPSAVTCRNCGHVHNCRAKTTRRKSQS
jgi:hypothetical protein